MVTSFNVIGFPKNPTIKDLNRNDRRKLGDTVRENFYNWSEQRKSKEDKWTECWNSFFGVLEEKKLGYCNIHRRILYVQSLAVLSTLKQQLFPQGTDFFTYQADVPNGERISLIIEELIRKGLDKQNFIDRYGQYLLQKIICGSSVAAVTHRIKYQEKYVYEQNEMLVKILQNWVPPEMLINKVKKPVMIDNDTYFEPIDIFDFVIDPSQLNYDEATVIRRIKTSVQGVKANKYYNNVKKIIPATNEDLSAKMEQDDGNNMNFWHPSKNPDGTTYTFEMWGDFKHPSKEEYYENYVCEVAPAEDGMEVIRFEANPFDHQNKPYIFSNYINIPNQIYGMGVVEPCLDDEKLANILTNQKVDNISAGLGTRIFYQEDDLFEPDDPELNKPFGRVLVQNINNIKFAEAPQNYSATIEEISSLIQQIEEKTGALKYQKGGTSSKDDQRTLGEVELLVSGSNEKFTDMSMKLEKEDLEPFIRMYHSNMRQFMTQPVKLQIPNDYYTTSGLKDIIESEGYDIDLEPLVGIKLLPDPGGLSKFKYLQILPMVYQLSDGDFIVTGRSGNQTKQRSAAVLLKLLDIGQNQLVMQSMQAEQWQLGVKEIIKKVYLLSGYKDIDEVVKEGNQQAQMQQIQQMQQGASLNGQPQQRIQGPVPNPTGGVQGMGVNQTQGGAVISQLPA